QSFATARRQVPPPLGGPALVLPVADRDPDPAGGVVAETEIGGGRFRSERDRDGHERATKKDAGRAAQGPSRVLCGSSVSHRFQSGRISREASWAVNEDSPKIIDVCVGWPWYQKVTKLGEEFGRIVVGKKLGRIEAQLAGTRQGAAVDISTRGVLGVAGAPGGAVGVARERRDVRLPAERERQGEGVFLVRPAPASAADRHGQFAAGEEDRAPALGLQVDGTARVLGRNLARLALDIG